MEVASGHHSHHQPARPFMAPQQHHNSGDSYNTQYSHVTPRSSDSTQNTAHSTLFQTPPPLSHTPSFPNGAHIVAANNVINRVADKETSLFQICLGLVHKLRRIGPLDDELMELEAQMASQEDDVLATDPVNLLWTLFKRGLPLVTLFNTLRPEQALVLDSSKMQGPRREKAAAFKFLQGCITILGFPAEDCFIISDLYGSDTGGFVKVARVVSRVVDLLIQEGVITTLDSMDSQGSTLAPGAKRTHRQHVVDELVRTERTYVQHLETLQAFKRQVEQRGVINGDSIHEIFLNLNALLDFQRRFLIRVEQTNAQPEAEQNWGHLFVSHRHAFEVYKPYIENQKKCEAVATGEYQKLKETGGDADLRQLVESPTHLTAFLLKPFQRLSKYPLLLRELHKKGDFDESRRNDLEEGRKAIEGILNAANATIAHEERQVVVEQLKGQVEDWKGHRVEAFGDLLLHGTFSVTKGDPKSDKAREYQMYLFEKILLCCKDVDSSKQRNRVRNNTSASQRGRPKLQLKGRIFMQNVTETMSMSSPGDYTCQIHWRGDDAIEFFVIRFQNDETMVKWRATIDQQRRACQEQSRHVMSASMSENDFIYMQNQGPLENPYREDEDGEEDATSSAVSSHSDLTSIARNASNQSLRSRSGTGESGNGSRFPPGRLPNGLPQPALNLRTQDLAPSPGERGGNSYFSPSVESPISTRTSASSALNMFPFPRQSSNLSQQSSYSEDSNRFTAPAGRSLVRDPQTGSFSVDPRNSNQRPPNGGYPAHPAALAQTRSRSASSPDIHNFPLPGRNTPVNAPPVPSIPAQLTMNNPAINRSQNNSPIYNLPVRNANTSPNSKRPTAAPQQQYGPYGGGVVASRSVGSISQPSAPAMSSPLQNGEVSQPAQIKVKVAVPSEGSTMTLVVGFNINYQSLRDRIDAKLQRVTNLSLQSGGVKLKYLCDDDYVSIQTDEDVQTAFETWREQNPEPPGQMGEITLYCHR